MAGKPHSPTVGVTGASGHIGNVICRQLLEKGYRVKALYRTDRRSLADLEGKSEIKLIQGDVLNPDDLAGFVGDCDVIINSAAYITIAGDPTGMVHKTNTQGPENLVKACRTAGALKKIIHISSTHAVMEIPHNTPFDETRPYKQKGAFAYDYSKACGEQVIMDAIRSKFIEGCILRPSSVIGPFDFKPSEMGKAFLNFYNQTVPILPPGGYNFVDVRDVAGTIINAMDKGANGEIYLLSGRYHTIRELSRVIHKVTGRRVPSMAMPFWLMYILLPLVKLHGRIMKAAPVFTHEAIYALKHGHPGMVNRKAAEALGHTCRPLEDSVRDFYEWNRTNKIIQ